MPSNHYETDFYAWTLEQSKLLKDGDFKHLDITNLVEEMGKQQRQELRNRLSVLIGHLLKWDYQPDKRSKTWRVTIREQRREILQLLQENPSLKPYLEEAITHAHESGLETPLEYGELPENCPYTFKQLFDPDFPTDLNYPHYLNKIVTIIST